ncbi:MAG TPA: saccharopine dehydrogenase C-terminal domain-containing protein [Chroococcales cyanobacterium]
MKFFVMGAGRMGYAVVYDLIRSPKVEQVIVADRDPERVQALCEKICDDKIVPVELDVSKLDDVIPIMAKCQVAISCLNSDHNYELCKAALEAQTHFCDLGGGLETLKKQLLLNELARERDITIMPALGLAPGMVSLLSVVAAESLDELYEIRIRAGGVPVDPEDLILKHCQLFSVDALIAEYVADATIIRDGKLYHVPSLTDVERIEFPKPFGAMDAFNTSGGIATLAERYLGKVQHLDFKTIRYPGHCEQVALLKDLGLMSGDTVELESGSAVQPRELISHLFADKLSKDEPDAVLLRITVTGMKDKKPLQIVWECVDYSDLADSLSAVMRMSAFPASIIAQMIARGDIKERGVLNVEGNVPIKLFLAELAGRGITLTMTERAPVPHSS